MDLHRALELVLADTREGLPDPSLDARDALAIAFEADMDDVNAVVEDPELVKAYQTVYTTDRAVLDAAVTDQPHLGPAGPEDHGTDPDTDRGQRAAARRRDTEDQVLAAADQLAEDDHSLAAEQVRDTAESIREHREMDARREQWAREDAHPGTAAERYWLAGASHQPGHTAEAADTAERIDEEAGHADPWRPAAAPDAGQQPAPRPAVSADAAERTRACVARTDEALRACDQALGDLADADTAQAEHERAAELARRAAQERAAEADPGLDREI